MTKAQLRSLVKNALGKIDNTNKYHNNVIDHSIEHAINQIYGDLFRNNPGDLDDYTASYEGSIILLEASSKIYYTTLPQAIVPVNDKASGVRHVAAYTAGSVLLDYDFVPMSRREADLTGGTYSGATSVSEYSPIGYIVRRNRIEYYNLTANDWADYLSTATIRFDLLVPFTAFEDTDIVTLPFGQDMKIQEMAMVFLQQIQEPDLKDDN